jgi:hypothetical protein
VFRLPTAKPVSRLWKKLRSKQLQPRRKSQRRKSQRRKSQRRKSQRRQFKQPQPETQLGNEVSFEVSFKTPLKNGLKPISQKPICRTFNSTEPEPNRML